MPRKPTGMQFEEIEADLPFPLEGVDQTRAYMRQRSGTSATAQNVRSFDPATDRARGAQRHGLVRYFPNPAVGAFPIQGLDHLVFGSSSAGVQQTNSGSSYSTPGQGGAPAPGQFSYALAVGSGFGVANGTNGTALAWSPVGATAGYQFACSCWDSNGVLYVCEVNQTTGGTKLYAYNANGNQIWAVTGPPVATGANRNVCGMSANATSGELFIAVIGASAPVYQVWDYQTANGVSFNFSGNPVPILANTNAASFGGHAAANVLAALAFSTGSVNCLAVLKPAASSVVGIDSQGVFVILTSATTTSVKSYTYTGLTKSAAARSRVVSDGVANWYVLAAVVATRLIKMTSAGVIAWKVTTYDAGTPQDLAFDVTGPNRLWVVGTASGSLKSANAVNVSTGALVVAVNAGAVTTWNAVGTDGKGNLTLWRDSVASNDVMGANNNASTVWGPSTLANAVHSGASVNTVSVSTGNVITVTNPTTTRIDAIGNVVSLTCTASDTGGALALTWTATGLPSGLSIASGTGVISGTIAGPATGYTTTITATDTGSFTGSITITWAVIAVGGDNLSITNPGAKTATVGTAFSLTVTATDSGNSPLRWFAVGLPPGLTIGATSGVISGTPVFGGAYIVTVYVNNTFGNQQSAAFPLSVSGVGASGSPGRHVVGLAVSNGEIRTFTAAGAVAIAGGVGALDPNVPVVWSAPCLQQMFYVDGAGYVYFDPATNTVKTWTATSGTLPLDQLGQTATLIALWRGRIVLSGLPNDPANWFMSASLNPLDYNYSPATTSTTQAVAGNNSSAGLIGDVITCLLPYTDDTMILACSHSMWLLSGDPADGGQITNISHTLGMAWGRPYAIDPVGQVYFMGSDRGIYKIVPGALPVRISQAVNNSLLAVDLRTNLVTMAWDMVNQGLAVFITPYVAGATTHYFWEQRTNSWWPQVFANTNHDPMAVHVFNGDNPDDELTMLGGRDGYVRVWNENSATDDGTAIASFVMIGPLSTRQLDEIMLKELHATLGVGSGQVTWSVYVGATAEAALASAAVATGTWAAGRNNIEYVRRSGIQVYLRLSAAAPFAVERIMARYAPMGRIRRRGTQT